MRHNNYFVQIKVVPREIRPLDEFLFFIKGKDIKNERVKYEI